jgi:parvulin-like peptidyl-prolyl isomerase
MVNGSAIWGADLRRELWRVHGAPEAGDTARLPLARALLEQMVDERLLLEEARRQGVTVVERESQAAWEATQDGYRSKEFKDVLHAQMLTPERLRERLEERLMVERFLKEHLRDLPPIPDSAVEAHYERERSRYQVAEQVRARQVVVRTAEQARMLLQRLRAGEDFARVAREHSVAPERERDGDLGYFSRGVLPAVFDRVCFALQPGQISDVVTSEYGSHIFQLTERRPASQRPLVLVADEIRDTLRREQREKAEAALLSALRKRANIVQDPSVLTWAADLKHGGVM